MSRLHPHPSLSFVLSLAAWFVGATRNTEGRVPRRSARPLGLFALLTLGLALGTGIAQPTYAATTITVNTTNDDAVTDGHCSLREAIANANANLDNTGGDCMSGSSGLDTIDLSSLSGTITLTSDLPAITGDAMISGPGPSALTINANGNLHVFQLLLPNQVTVAGLTLTGATAGAIHNTAITTLSDDNIIGNNNTSSRGRVGGVFTAGTMTIQNSAVNDNAGISAGGILNLGTLVVSNSTISGNIGRQGGGISNNFTLTVEDCTISGNTAGAGGGIASGNIATIKNSTIANNTATSIGGGIYGGGLIQNAVITGNGVGPGGFAPGIFSGGNITLVNTILAGQTGGPNCVGVSGGSYNIEDGASCDFRPEDSSLSNTDPLLDPAGLQNNGGPTQTIALLAGSPAIDGIPAGVNGCGTTLTSDQRGISRPQGGGCDIGAFEVVEMLMIAIDIKPGEIPNAINPRSNGMTVVAIISNTSFDSPSLVDTMSLKFGRTGNESSLFSCNPPQDINIDGLPDLVCRFKTQKTAFLAGDTQGVLTGKTIGGLPIKGTDSVVIVGRRKPLSRVNAR